MSRTTATACSIVTCLTAALGACHRPPPDKLKLLSGEGDTVDIGREIQLPPAAYTWSFRANPGDVLRVRVDWPPASVHIQVGSDLRTDRDDDDATHVEEGEGVPDGPHRTRATLRVHSKANAAWIRLSPQGRGFEPMRVRIDRGE